MISAGDGWLQWEVVRPPFGVELRLWREGWPFPRTVSMAQRRDPAMNVGGLWWYAGEEAPKLLREAMANHVNVQPSREYAKALMGAPRV
jgi:hypothetical protein